MGNVITFARDKLQSLVSMLGTERDKASTTFYGVPEWSDEQLINAYRGAWLPKKIVNIPALDACRKWRDWQAEADQITAIEAEEKRLNIKARVLEARIKARLFGGAAIFIGTGDSDPSMEFRPESVNKGGIRYLNVMTRRRLTAGDIEQDPQSEWYDKPRWYELQSATAGVVRIHPSRLVLFTGDQHPDDELAAIVNKGWGDSVLISTMNAIKNSDSTAANIASLVFEAKVDVIRIPNFMSSLSDESYKTRLLERFQLAATGKGINQALILDTDEEYQQKSASFQTLPDVMRSFMELVAGAADIPLTRLLGTSPGGMNSTGDADLRNYYDRIQAGQELEMQPAMQRLDEALIRSALGARPADIFYNWSPLWQVSEKEQAEIGKANAETIDKLNNTGLFPPEALANASINMLTENGVLPGLDQAVEDAGGLPDYEMEVEAEREAEQARLEAAQNGNVGDRYNPNQPRNNEGEWTSGGGGLSPAETSAVDFYKNKNFKKVNTGLRKGSVPDDVKDHVASLDSAIGKQEGFKKSTTLYRGIKSKALADQARKDPSSLIGKDMTDDGFMSTSTSTGAAKHFAGASFGGSKSGVIMSIKAPKGTKALSMDEFTKNKNVFKESEMLLARGSKVRIKKISEWNGAVLIEGELR